MVTEQRTQPARPSLRSAAFALRETLDAPHTVAGALLIVLLLRLAFGLLALPVSAAFPDTALEQRVGLQPGDAPLGEWLQRVAVQPWQRYDAWNYVRIVEHGYRLEDGTAAFHPLFPLLAAPLARLLGGNALLALLLVATAAAVSLCVTFARYVRRFHPNVSAGRATWLLLLAPPARVDTRARARTCPAGTSNVIARASANSGMRSMRIVATAITPCPHIVLKPSLCMKSTPVSESSRSGGVRSAPYMSACPRGSSISTRRNRS